MERFILSIDQGTTGSTVLVFDEEGRIRGRAYSEFTQHYPKPGWVEHDPEELWSVTLEVVRDALGSAGIQPDALAGIGITNQRETTLLWDRASGKPVANATMDESVIPLTNMNVVIGTPVRWRVMVCYKVFLASATMQLTRPFT